LNVCLLFEFCRTRSHSASADEDRVDWENLVSPVSSARALAGPPWLPDGHHDGPGEDGRVRWRRTDPWETGFVDITGVWVPETLHTSRDLLILVEQSTESVAPLDGAAIPRNRRDSVRLILLC
jgi:hypothetical protein